jgi:hypothetical protein
MSRATRQDILTAKDPCFAGEITPDMEREIKTVALHNLVSVLSGDTTQKRPLPYNIRAMIFGIGSPSHQMDLIAWEGISIEARKHRVHELKHFLEREEAEIARMEEQNNGNKPKKRHRRSPFRRRNTDR